MVGYYQSDLVIEAELDDVMDMPDPSVDARFGTVDAAGGMGPLSAERDLGARDTLIGTDVSSWLYDYYFRLWVIPNVQDFGTVTGTTDRSVALWNTFFATFTWQSLEETDAEGLSWPGLSLPDALASLGFYSYTHRASADGPLAIDASYRLVGDLGHGDYRALGSRGMLLPWEPDWSRPVRVSVARRSRVEAALTEAEDRADMTERALIRLRWEVLPRTAREAAMLRMALNRSRTLGLRVPIWPDYCELTATASPGATVLRVDETAHRRWRAGGHVMLVGDFDDAEARELGVIGANTLELSEPLVGTWPAGTRVYPAIGGYLSSLPKFSSPTDEHFRAEISVEEAITV